MSEYNTGYIDEDFGLLYVDYWETEDNNEKSKVIAKINIHSLEVLYDDESHKNNPRTQAIINEAKEELKTMEFEVMTDICYDCGRVQSYGTMKDINEDDFDIFCDECYDKKMLNKTNKTMNELIVCNGLGRGGISTDNLVTLSYQGMLHEIKLEDNEIEDYWHTIKNNDGKQFDVNIWIDYKSKILCDVYQIKIDDEGWCDTDTSKWETIKVVRKEGIANA